MRYFSMFSGIGGFEKGLEDAFMLIKDKELLRSTTATGDQAGRGEQLNNVSNAGLSCDRLPNCSDYSREPQAQGELSAEGKGSEGEYSKGCINNTESNALVCVGFSEIDKNAINIYLKHYPGHHNYGSATDINAAELPDFDLLVGGFPYQAFSIAGKRLGFEDTRGTLFFEIARILREKRPGQFLLENVKGLLSHDNGNTFKTIISTLVELGYCVEWQVLNSKNYGVPQNRERVFIHGFREGCGRQVFPIGQSNGETGADIKRIGHNEVFRRYNQTYDPRGGCESIDVSGGGGHQPCIPVKINRGFVEPTKDTSLCLDAHYSSGLDDHGARQGIQSGIKIRRLTPIECERLQGFPDDWTKYGADGRIMSDSARYKACGNAVTTNVIRAIMEAMYE